MIVYNELKGCGRKWSWPNLRYYSSIYMEGLFSVGIVAAQPIFKPGTSQIEVRSTTACEISSP
jgi:hypothetical protein